MKDRKQFESVSSYALKVLIALTVCAIFANALIMVGGYADQFSKFGTFGMLFDYSNNVGHPARMLGQALSNVVAYVFVLAAIVIFILSLVLIKHDKKAKVKCAVIGLALIIPATLGLTGGVIDFVAHGFGVLNTTKGLDSALTMAFLVSTLLLDIVYLVLAIISLVKGIGTAVKVNKGELAPVAEEETKGPREESAEEKAAREEKEAADRVELLNNVREIVREELDKLDRVVIAKEVRTVVKEAAPAPVPAPAPAPAPVEEAEEEAKKLSIQRIPFAEKIVKADKELQARYNEIKSELLAYGASSRVSIAGDTFRLHRKPYVKITVVGKTLKVYFALNPNDFVDSPIPVADASDKVAYEEVPALLKVKSNLAVKRAKDLAEMAFGADGFKKEKDAVEHNWVKDIRAELKAKNGK